MNFFHPVAEFTTIIPVIFIAVFAPRTKKLSACDNENEAADATADPVFI